MQLPLMFVVADGERAHRIRRARERVHISLIIIIII